jgi:hypothetical protein
VTQMSFQPRIRVRGKLRLESIYELMIRMNSWWILAYARMTEGKRDWANRICHSSEGWNPYMN